MWAFLWIRPNPIIAVCVFSYNLQRSVHKKWRIVLTLWAGSHGVPNDRDCRDWPQVTWDLGHVWTSPHSVSIYVVHKCPACGSFSIVLFAEWREFKFLIWLIWRSKFSVKLACSPHDRSTTAYRSSNSVSLRDMHDLKWVAPPLVLPLYNLIHTTFWLPFDLINNHSSSLTSLFLNKWCHQRFEGWWTTS